MNLNLTLHLTCIYTGKISYSFIVLLFKHGKQCNGHTSEMYNILDTGSTSVECKYSSNFETTLPNTYDPTLDHIDCSILSYSHGIGLFYRL